MHAVRQPRDRASESCECPQPSADDRARRAKRPGRGGVGAVDPPVPNTCRSPVDSHADSAVHAAQGARATGTTLPLRGSQCATSETAPSAGHRPRRAGRVKGGAVRGPLAPHSTVAPRCPPGTLDPTATTSRAASTRKPGRSRVRTTRACEAPAPATSQQQTPAREGQPRSPETSPDRRSGGRCRGRLTGSQADVPAPRPARSRPTLTPREQPGSAVEDRSQQETFTQLTRTDRH